MPADVPRPRMALLMTVRASKVPSTMSLPEFSTRPVETSRRCLWRVRVPELKTFPNTREVGTGPGIGAFVSGSRLVRDALFPAPITKSPVTVIVDPVNILIALAIPRGAELRRSPFTRRWLPPLTSKLPLPITLRSPAVEKLALDKICKTPSTVKSLCLDADMASTRLISLPLPCRNSAALPLISLIMTLVRTQAQLRAIENYEMFGI